MDVKKRLKDIYYDYENPAALGTFSRVKGELGDKSVSDEEIQDFLLGQPSYSLFKKRQTKFPRRRIRFEYPWETAACDLCDLSKIASKNRNYKWIFVARDICSNAIFVEPLKQKSFTCVKEAFEKLIAFAKSFGFTIKKVWSDRGKSL